MKLATPKSARGGFTLIELIVVLSIILILTGLVAGGIYKVVESQKVAATEGMLIKIDNALETQWRRVVKQASDTPIQTIESRAPLLATLGNNSPQVVRVLWVKVRLHQEFPEALNQVDAGAKPGYAERIGTIPTADPADIDAAARQSAALLYMAVTQSRGGGQSFDPDASFGNRGVEEITIDGQAYKVFVDLWGTPIYFVYASDDFTSLRSTELDSGIYAASNSGGSLIDPADPLALLQTITAANRPTARTVIGHQVTTAQNYTPYVASAGPDKQYGTADDILSYRLRREGQ